MVILLGINCIPYSFVHSNEHIMNHSYVENIFQNAKLQILHYD
jgi:hypothetical protein